MQSREVFALFMKWPRALTSEKLSSYPTFSNQSTLDYLIIFSYKIYKLEKCLSFLSVSNTSSLNISIVNMWVSYKWFLMKKQCTLYVEKIWDNYLIWKCIGLQLLSAI